MRSAIVSALALVTMVVVGTGRGTAEVVSASEMEFSTAAAADAGAPPDAVYRALTEIGRWWSPAHTFSGDAGNLRLEARAGGCWCEQLPGGGSVRHLVVVYADPPRMLRLQGGLGPLQGLAVAGTLTWTLTPAENGTHVELTYAVSGYTAGGLQQLATPVDGVLTEQLGRLVRYAETGSAEPAAR